MSWFVSLNLATIFWDVDSYYIHHSIQEAGKFFREYQQHPVLGKTFPADIPSNFKKLGEIQLYGASQPVGQAKLMAHLLSEKLKSGFKPEETLIVLPDEKLVMPVLHGVSSEVEKLNVTMGFPLTSTPLFNLVELVVEMQINYKDDAFNHQQVIAILGHPYVVAADAGEAQAKRRYILRQNWVMVPVNYLASAVTLHRELFRRFKSNPQAGLTNSIIDYLRSMIIGIGRLKNLQALDREFCFHFLKLLNQLERVILPSGDHTEKQDDSLPDIEKKIRKEERLALKSFLRLFRQLVRLEKIPFRGEPLQGLQVMGVLETRNLDFKNVFILSLNEGSFPSFNSRGSYIPMNIRKAYGLPIPEHQDSIYAYLFYRILQRAENVYLFHNTETDDLGQGELSRYVQQLIFESGIPIKRHILHNDLQPLEITPITVVKDESVYTGLARYCTGNAFERSLSPSALNDYLECRLRFYFRYIAKVREAREIEEDLDARVLGNFVHLVMEYFYQHILTTKNSKLIEQKDFDIYRDIDPLIDKAFIKNYNLDPDKKVVYEGQRLVVKEVVRRFVKRIIDIDREYAPFTIEALERRDITFEVKVHAEGNPVVLLGGSIDRADRKENVIRVVDYKTGKDDLTFSDVASLFSRDTKRNKAAFQTLLYTFLYKKAEPHPGLKFVPGLLNRLNLFKDDFRFGLIQDGNYLNDATPLLPEFEASVVTLLNELYSPDIPFDQTTNTKNCEFCSYQRICYR
jgi:CRISPR/Cas system-associated exonuclease Cas4 (RecB family)